MSFLIIIKFIVKFDNKWNINQTIECYNIWENHEKDSYNLIWNILNRSFIIILFNSLKQMKYQKRIDKV